MKRVYALALAATVTAFVTMLLGSTTTSPAGQVVTYSAPSGMALSSEYTVRVRPVGGAWQALDVYRTTVDLDTLSEAAMVSFDASGPVQVEIAKLTGTMHAAQVRPLAYAITPSLSADGKTAMFVLPRPLNVSFEADGDRLHNVQVFANPIERNVPRAGPKVIFFGPGAHILPGDHVLRVPSDTTVYVAGGAVVQGALLIANAHNVLVRGHGIVDPSGYFKAGVTSTVRIDHSSNVGIRDITVLRSQSGGFNIVDSDGVTIANAREVNADKWSDGVDVVASSNVLVDNVFLRTSDDSIAVFASPRGRGGTRNVAVRNSTLWADVAHPILVGTLADPTRPEVIQRLDFQNIDILEHDEYREGGLYQGTMAVDAGNRVIARDIRFDDVRVEDFTRGQLVNVRVFLNPDYNKQPGTSVNRVLFRDVGYEGHGDLPSRVEGYDASRQVQNVIFENLTYNGTTVLDPSAGNIVVGPFAQNVVFRPHAEAATFDDTARTVHYTGRWRRIPSRGSLAGSVHSASSPQGRMTFRFTGLEARVYGVTAPDRGKVDVFVDGTYASTVDTYSFARRTQQIWFDTGVLAAGRHTLEVRCRGIRNRLATGTAIALDRVDVVR